MARNTFYNDPRWNRKREKVLRRDYYMCQISKRYGKSLDATTVHHIIPLDWCLVDKPELALASVNLISVSEAVHNTLHDRYTGKLTKEGLDLVKRHYRGNMDDYVVKFLAYEMDEGRNVNA